MYLNEQRVLKNLPLALGLESIPTSPLSKSILALYNIVALPHCAFDTPAGSACYGF
jgi:hypothetical protein